MKGLHGMQRMSITRASGAGVSLGPIGSPSDYRIVVVNGDCEFESATGYGILLVRGDLELNGTSHGTD